MLMGVEHKHWNISTMYNDVHILMIYYKIYIMYNDVLLKLNTL